jgi:tetratricopeptide (TPR) repeat protein
MPLRKGLLFLSVALFLFSGATAHAQQVTGQVRYADTNQPVYNANIHCEGANTSQIQQTDRSGKFTCLLGSPGGFTVRVDASGYFSEQQSGNALDNHASEYMLFRLKPDPKAKAVASAASPTDPNVPPEARKAFDKGVQAISVGKKEKIEEGAHELEKAVSIYPKFLEAQVKLGAAYMDLQQWDKAEPAFKQALEIEPRAANALFALGEIYLRLKRVDEAKTVLLQGLQIDDSSAQGHLALARAYWEDAAKIKDDAQARTSLETAYNQVNQSLKLDPGVAQAHLLKGNLLLRVRRGADAQHEYEEYLRLEPKGPFAEQTRLLVEKIKKALESQPKP